jgi:hypothetical protein
MTPEPKVLGSVNNAHAPTPKFLKQSIVSDGLTNHEKTEEAILSQTKKPSQKVLPPRHAERAQDREGRDCPKAGSASVLDVAAGLGLWSVRNIIVNGVNRR